MDAAWSTKLPELTTRYQVVPRRYEDTRPVLVQSFAHRKIIGIGHDIHMRLLESLQADKLESIKRVEEDIWRQADIKRDDAVRSMREEMDEERKKALAEQSKAHEEHIKEEHLKVEMRMQNMAIEQVNKEREKWEKYLAESVVKTEERCAKEIARAVVETRKEEQFLADERVRNLKQIHSKELQSVKMKAAEEKARALAFLEEAMKDKLEKAVQVAHLEEQVMASILRAQMKEEFRLTLEAQTAVADTRMDEILKLRDVVAKLEKEKTKLREYLEYMHKSFLDCFERLPMFDGQSAECLLPSICFEEIEQGLPTAD